MNAKEQPAGDTEELRQYLAAKLAEELLTHADIQGKVDSVDAAHAMASFLLERFEVTRK